MTITAVLGLAGVELTFSVAAHAVPCVWLKPLTTHQCSGCERGSVQGPHSDPLFKCMLSNLTGLKAPRLPGEKEERVYQKQDEDLKS